MKESRTINRGLSKAQKDWAKLHIPTSATLVNGVRIDVETIRLSFIENEKLQYILVKG